MCTAVAVQPEHLKKVSVLFWCLLRTSQTFEKSSITSNKVGCDVWARTIQFAACNIFKFEFFVLILLMLLLNLHFYCIVFFFGHDDLKFKAFTHFK